MPAPIAPWVPMALGSVAARGANQLYRWADSRYISSGPAPPSTSVRTAMKRRTFSRTRSQRRRFKRRRRGIIRRRIPRSVAPREKLIRVNAVVPPTLACTSGAIGVFALKMFDITDPFGTATNVQPLGYDQWKGLYNKAFVVGVKVVCRIHNKGTAAVMVGVTPMPESQANSGLSPFEHYMELAGTKSRLLSPDVDHCVLVSKIGTARHVGVRKLRDEDAFHCDLDGEVAPTRDAWVHVWGQPIDKTTTNPLELVVTAEYLVRLYDPIIPARATDT